MDLPPPQILPEPITAPEGGSSKVVSPYARTLVCGAVLYLLYVGQHLYAADINLFRASLVGAFVAGGCAVVLLWQCLGRGVWSWPRVFFTVIVASCVVGWISLQIKLHLVSM